VRPLGHHCESRSNLRWINDWTRAHKDNASFTVAMNQHGDLSLHEFNRHDMTQLA
jgi:hypothetical protein